MDGTWEIELTRNEMLWLLDHTSLVGPEGIVSELLRDLLTAVKKIQERLREERVGDD